MKQSSARTLHRRALLMSAASGGIAAFLAACGGATSPTTPPANAPRGSAAPATAATAQPAVVPASPTRGMAGSVPGTTAPGGSAAARVGGGLLRASIPFLPQQLDPAIGTAGSTIIGMGLGETLIYSTPQGQAQPWLAESIEALDPSRWRIRLRPGVTFHNGKPVDGAAVQRSLARTIEKNKTAAGLLNAAKVEALDERTVIVETAGANGGVPEILTSFYFVIYDAEEAARAGDNAFAARPVLTGPFQIVDFRGGEFATVRRYDGYWQGTAQIERAEFRNVSDANARLAALLAGDADLARFLPAQSLSQVRAANQQVATTSFAGMYHIFLNNKRPPFDDKAVRQAMSLAVDRKTLIERVLNGGEHARGLFPFNLPYAGKEPLPFDPNRARQLLDGAGWRAGSDGVRVKEDKRLEFELLTYPQRPELGLIGTVLVSLFKEVGIAVTGVRTVEDITKPVNAGDYGATMYSMQTAPTGDPTYVLNLLYKSTASQNIQLGYTSAALDKVIDALTGEIDATRRLTLARQAQEILIEDTPAIYLMQPLTHTAHAPKVRGIEAHPVEQYLLNHRWSIQ